MVVQELRVIYMYLLCIYYVFTMHLLGIYYVFRTAFAWFHRRTHYGITECKAELEKEREAREIMAARCLDEKAATRTDF